MHNVTVKHWFLPTQKNGFRAKLITAPTLVVITLIVLSVNWLMLPYSVAAARNDINKDTLLAEHNEQRKKFDLAPLKFSESLSNSAQRKAKAMLEADCWSHFCPEGKSPWDFFAEAGYDYVVAGENLAEGFYSADAVITAWMNSPTHRENILRADYEEIGFGVVQGDFQGRDNNIVITVHFGTPRSSLATDFFDISGNGDLKAPEIVTPKNNQFINNKTVNISGLAGEASLVSLYLGQDFWRDVDADKGIFTYNADLDEGTYRLSAVGKVGTRRSDSSKTVEFTVDLNGNSISPEDIILLENQNDNLKISIVSPDLTELKLSVGENRAYQFDNTEGDLWIGYIALTEFENDPEFEISTLDKAGNKWQSSLVSKNILDAASQVKLKEITGDSSSGRIVSVDIKSQFNFGAFIVLISLFGIDFYAVSRTGLTKYMGKSAFHFAILMIILLIVLGGAFTGQILEGINI